MERAVPFPLRRKLGLFALFSLGILATVCAVGVHQFVALRTDGRRLLEESRELALANDLDAHFEAMALVLNLEGVATDDEPRAFLGHQVEDIRRILHDMDDAPGVDPSREGHQAEELALSHSLDSRLALLAERIASGTTGPLTVEETRIEEMRALGARLEHEAREEAEHAERDLRERSRRAIWVMVGTVALATLGLLAMLFLVLRTVVRPLRALERRATALGHGDYSPGPPIESDDEIGALAQAFDEMASKVSATRNALEGRVAARTRELARAARYADLGVLAAGVAHEINNPLATIATCAEGMQRRLERGTLDPREESEYFRTIASEAYRARDITKRLLTLARREPAPATRVALGELLQELRRVTRHQLEQSGVALEVDGPSDVVVRGNSGELLQALVNLVLNARDASPRGAVVRIGVAREDGHARLDVDDQGPGVPAERMERIFEPFFTTKPPGEGTGLGLSLVAAIVEDHRGSIVVGRAPGGGARFRLRIPLDEGTSP